MQVLLTDDQWITYLDLLAEQQYVVIDDLLSSQDLINLKTCFDERVETERFKKAAIGPSNQMVIDNSVRGDNILWLDEQSGDDRIQQFFNLADLIKQKLNRYCFLSISGYEFHFAHFPIGAFYKRHLDQFKGRGNRLISFVLYLNQEWQPEYGGGLTLFLANKELVISPSFGRIVLMQSAELEHEVMATKMDRYSVTGWMLHKPADLIHL